ncbi:22262_t:CDS:2, partial [Cetraspora pellucida]
KNNCSGIVSENKEEILIEFKKQLYSVSVNQSSNKKAHDKATKFYKNVKNFNFKEIVAFFVQMDEKANINIFDAKTNLYGSEVATCLFNDDKIKRQCNQKDSTFEILTKESLNTDEDLIIGNFNVRKSLMNWKLKNNLLHDEVHSFERDHDLLNEALSERMYREMFLTPLVTNLFQKEFKNMEIYLQKNLFASAEDFDLKKDDKENRSNGRKIDIVWATKPLKIEFAIAEISGPPNEHQHSHYFSDKIKIAKMLKIMLNRIVRVYGGAKTNLNLLKLYGLQVYNHIVIVYELLISYKGIYIFREVTRTNLPTTSINISLLRRCVPTFLFFKEIIIESLRNINQYIMEAGLSTPIDYENASLFLTPMTYSSIDEKIN